MDQCILGSIDDGKGKCILIATVYASTKFVERRALWDFLQEHCANLNCLLIIGGDFNCVLGQDDKKGGKHFAFNSSAQDLWRCMISCDLKETRFSGPRFTWTNNKDGASKIWVRHDRFLINSVAMHLMPYVLTHHLTRVASDHAPILLKLFEPSASTKPIIRFEDTWVSYHQTRRIIRAKWLMKAKGSAADILNRKCLKTLRALFFWSKNKLQELTNSKFKLEASLLQLQNDECSEISGSDYNRIINKALKLVHAWGLKTLSLAGRSSLIKSSLGTLITYQLAHTKVPLSIIDKVDRICRSFLWQDKEDHGGIHYVSWKKICLPKEQGGLGIKSMRMWSGPVRARLAWHSYQFPLQWHNSLLREAYGDSLDLVVSKPGRSWKILQDGWRSLKGAVRWKICDGASVSILKDTWLLDQRFEDWPTFYNASIDESGRVGDLLEDGCWKESEIRELFGQCLAEIILNITVFSDLGADKPELIFSTLSNSVSSQVFGAQFKQQDERFGWLRLVKLLPRETMFWWRLIHDAIPTQDWMVRKGLEISELCVWGCLVKEDLNHIMYHCKFSLKVYTVLLSWGFPLPCLQKDSMVKKEKVYHFTQVDTLFLKTVYQIWLNKNRKKHADGSVSPNMVAALVLGNFNLVNLSILWKQWDTNRLYPIDYSWCPPPSKWLKFNIDGACKLPYRAGMGIVVRDATGKLIVAAGKQLLHWDVNFIELQSIALLKDVMNDELLGALGIIIEGDNQKVLQWLYKNIHLGRWKYNSLDFDLSFIRNFHHVILNFMPRRFNRAADFCAKQALNSSFCWKKEDDFNSLGVFVNILKEDAFRPP
ncbi:hypothetical protein M5K25_006942 [Dendrobium thyrsiflorum]|uniref:Uncharacterized protein n=1 Tax=Dendrobium thyrsiflorum TaxID=117978 RepID=A0ABD0VK37_DENTH